MSGLLNYELDSRQIQELNPDARVLLYDQIEHMSSIAEIFGPYRKVIILYLLQSRHEGHWCCMFWRGSQLNYFDSYGKPEDEELHLLTAAQRASFDERNDRLRELTRFQPVVYNHVRLQSLQTSTCGMFVTHRLHHSELDARQYVEIFRHTKLTPDQVVARYVGGLMRAKGLLGR